MIFSFILLVPDWDAVFNDLALVLELRDEQVETAKRGETLHKCEEVMVENLARWVFSALFLGEEKGWSNTQVCIPATYIYRNYEFPLDVSRRTRHLFLGSSLSSGDGLFLFLSQSGTFASRQGNVKNSLTSSESILY